MRPATVHDLIITTAVMIGFCLCTIVMQIVIITKSTIPADAVITEVRVFRSEATAHLESVTQKLAEIDAAIDSEIVRRNTINQMDNHGFSSN